jgi:hypothetical protein
MRCDFRQKSLNTGQTGRAYPADQRTAEGAGKVAALSASEVGGQRRRKATDDPLAARDNEAVEFGIAQLRQELDRRRVGAPTAPKLHDKRRIRLELRHCVASALTAPRAQQLRRGRNIEGRGKMGYVTQPNIGVFGADIKDTSRPSSRAHQAGASDALAGRRLSYSRRS